MSADSDLIDCIIICFVLMGARTARRGPDLTPGVVMVTQHHMSAKRRDGSLRV